MTDERALIQHMIDSWNDGGVGPWLECFSPDCVMKTDPAWPDGGVMVGREAVEHFARDFADQWETLSAGTGSAEQRGGRWLVETRWIAKGRSSGAETELPFTAVLRFRDGLIAEMLLFLDRADALAAADA
jgi:ketosteroid isomerase-like protein